jgi:hypothetical protein
MAVRRCFSFSIIFQLSRLKNCKKLPIQRFGNGLQGFQTSENFGSGQAYVPVENLVRPIATPAGPCNNALHVLRLAKSQFARDRLRGEERLLADLRKIPLP